MSGLGDIDEASYTGISTGVRASCTGDEPTDGCAGDEVMVCSDEVSNGMTCIKVCKIYVRSLAGVAFLKLLRSYPVSNLADFNERPDIRSEVV
jgi:hypothetical protein